MAVIRIQNVKQYAGNSDDLKPHVGDVVVNADGSQTLITAADLPAGSTLYLRDMGLTETYDGRSWNRPSTGNPAAANDPNAIALMEILLDIQMELARIRVGMIDAGTCNDNVAADFIRNM